MLMRFSHGLTKGRDFVLERWARRGVFRWVFSTTIRSEERVLANREEPTRSRNAVVNRREELIMVPYQNVRAAVKAARQELNVH